MVASIMDYIPANIMPKESQQGDYYPTDLGPYDSGPSNTATSRWAAARRGSGRVEEDRGPERRAGACSMPPTKTATRLDPDPAVNRFDLGNDPLEYARPRAQIVQQVLPGLVERTTKDGEDYTQVRTAVQGTAGASTARACSSPHGYMGGLDISRSHKGDKDAKPPVSLVRAAEQRAALDLLQEQVFSDKPFQFPPDLYNYLAASNWNHWGVSRIAPQGFPGSRTDPALAGADPGSPAFLGDAGTDTRY